MDGVDTIGDGVGGPIGLGDHIPVGLAVVLVVDVLKIGNTAGRDRGGIVDIREAVGAAAFSDLLAEVDWVVRVRSADIGFIPLVGRTREDVDEMATVGRPLEIAEHRPVHLDIDAGLVAEGVREGDGVGAIISSCDVGDEV